MLANDLKAFVPKAAYQFVAVTMNGVARVHVWGWSHGGYQFTLVSRRLRMYFGDKRFQ